MFSKLYHYIRQRQIASQLRKPSGTVGKKTGLMMNKANSFLYGKVVNIINPKAENKILEIGFGNGYFFSSFFEREANIKMAGVDYSSKMVKEAKQNNRKYIEDGILNIMIGESNNLFFADNTFDWVFCINVIYFWKAPAEHLQEIYRVLKPGGSFIAVFRTKESLQLMPFTRFGFIAWEKKEWEKLLSDNNFSALSHILIEEPEVEFKGKLYSIQSHCVTGYKQL